MRTQSKIVGGLALLIAVGLISPVIAQEKKVQDKKVQEKKVEKAKAEKVSGDIGLLDTEKNYMIVVTKDGKLVTVDFNQKTKVTALRPSGAKMSDIGLGSKASVQYIQKRGKNYLTALEYIAKKGGD